MPEKFLHGADVVAALEQMSGEAMPKGVATGRFGGVGGADGVFDGILQVPFGHVVAAFSAAARIDRNLIGGKRVLPDPIASGVGIFPAQGGREIDGPAPLGEILAMEFFHAGEMALEGPDEPLGQDGHPFVHAFAFAHRDLAIAEVDVFDA